LRDAERDGRIRLDDAFIERESKARKKRLRMDADERSKASPGAHARISASCSNGKLLTVDQWPEGLGQRYEHKHMSITWPTWALSLQLATTNSDPEQPFTIVDRATHLLP